VGDLIATLGGIGFKVPKDFPAHADGGVQLEGFGEGAGEIFG
jgi:hypothetical protein